MSREAFRTVGKPFRVTRQFVRTMRKVSPAKEQTLRLIRKPFAETRTTFRTVTSFPSQRGRSPGDRESFPRAAETSPDDLHASPDDPAGFPEHPETLQNIRNPFPERPDGFRNIRMPLPIVRKSFRNIRRLLRNIRMPLRNVRRAFPIVQKAFRNIRRALRNVRRGLPVIRRALPIVRKALPVVRRAFRNVRRGLPLARNVCRNVRKACPVARQVLPAARHGLDGRAPASVCLFQEDTMTGQEYEERRRAPEEQLRADIALLNAAHEARIRALDRLRQEAPGGELPAAGTEIPRATVQPAPPPAPKPMRPRYSVVNDLEAALPKLPQIFKRQDILRALGYEPPRTTLFRALNQLQEEGAITVDNHSPAAPSSATGSSPSTPSQPAFHAGVPFGRPPEGQPQGDIGANSGGIWRCGRQNQGKSCAPQLLGRTDL